MADFTALNGYNVKDTVAREGVNNLELSKASHADVAEEIATVNTAIEEVAQSVDDLETLFNASGVSKNAKDITFDNSANGFTSTNVQTAIEEVKESVKRVFLTGTLTAGETVLTISDTSINEDSIVDIYTNVYGVSPSDVAVTVEPIEEGNEEMTGKITMTFDAMESDLIIKVGVM